MEKEKIYKFLYFLSGVLIVGFIIRLGVDFFKYDASETSAPFYVFAIPRVIEFIIPSIVLFVVAFVESKKIRKQKNYETK